MKTIAFLQNVHVTNGIQFWQPCLFWPKNQKLFAKCPKSIRWSSGESIWIKYEFSSIKLSVPQKVPQDERNAVLLTLPMKFCQNPQKKSPRVRKKVRNYKISKETETSSDHPLNLLNALLRTVVKLFTEEFEKFWLKVRT